MKALLQQALDALENSIDIVSNDCQEYVDLYSKYPTRAARIDAKLAGVKAHEDAIEALKQELANDEKAQKPLADEEILKLADYHTTYQIESPSNTGMIEFARAIEAAHGIKENLCQRS